MVVSGVPAASWLLLLHIMVPALSEGSSAFTLSVTTGVITLGRVGSGPAAVIAWSATWLAIGSALLELGLLFLCQEELIHLLLLLEAKRFRFHGLSFLHPLSFSSSLATIWTIISSVRACAGVTFRELVGGVVLALHLLEDSPPKLFHCVALL